MENKGLSSTKTAGGLRKRLGGVFVAAAVATTLVISGGSAEAAGEATPPPSIDWSFNGIFGTIDRSAAQRGFQVYREVCAGCHSLDLVAFRNLADLGYSEEQIKAIAAEYTVIDGPDDFGEMFERPGRPADRFVSPFPNVAAARASNNGAYPPDMSLLVKARPNGANYVYGILTGYEDPPENVELMAGQYYNKYMPGHIIAMAPPLYEDGVDYQDGTAASVDQQAMDLTYFLTWASDPKMEVRKQMGVKVILFLLVLTVMLYMVKRRVWADVH